MSKSALVSLIAQKFKLGKPLADEIVTEVFQGMSSSLESQGSFSFVGFGRLEVVDRKARQGRNPNSGEPLMIAPRRVVKFTAGAPLKRQINAVKHS